MTANAETQSTYHRYAAILLLLAVTLAPAAQMPATEIKAVAPPGPKDKCPVCGMLVANFPSWVSSILYADGAVRHFDGPKDMFKYLLQTSKYEPQRQANPIDTIVVTEYYGLRKIDARKAFFVIGSDVHGPMGHELIPLASSEEAKEFLRDHKGSRILSFDKIDTRILDTLDEGKFE